MASVLDTFFLLKKFGEGLTCLEGAIIEMLLV